MPLAQGMMMSSGGAGLGHIGPNVIADNWDDELTKYSHQRKIDRTSNNVLWETHSDYLYDEISFNYSLDDGRTWVNAGRSNFRVKNFSFFIDDTDHAYVAYKHVEDHRIYCRRGIPNAARTGWTWSSAIGVGGIGPGYDFPDLVAYSYGSGWYIHVVAAYTSASGTGVRYGRVFISAAGTPTIEVMMSNTDGTLAYNGGAGGYPMPSIDFHHTGDSKAVKDGLPHVFVVWHAGNYGTTYGLKFRKLHYSGSSWSWNAERQIDSSVDMGGSYGSGYWFQCLFNGIFVTIVMFALRRVAGVSPYLMVWDRDVDDSMTVMRSSDRWAAGSDALEFGSSTYDSDGNIYVVGRAYGTGADIAYHRIDRDYSAGYFPRGPRTVLIPSEANVNPYIQLKRGHSGDRFDMIYTNGASPNQVIYYGMDI